MVQSKQDKPDKGSPPKVTEGLPEGNRIVLLLASLTVLAILAIAAFAVLATGGEDAEHFTPNNRGLLPTGSEAPGFTTEAVRGGDVSIGDGSAKATMLVFFATWCPRCNNEAPIISDLEEQYEDLRVVMVGIDGRDNPQKVREFVEKYDIEGPAVYQPSLGFTYQVSGFPTTYILNDNDEVVAAHSGEVPRSVYERWIEEALGSES
jgi:thiol-disulfide isomerase/thioredoxin